MTVKEIFTTHPAQSLNLCCSALSKAPLLFCCCLCAQGNSHDKMQISAIPRKSSHHGLQHIHSAVSHCGRCLNSCSNFKAVLPMITKYFVRSPERVPICEMCASIWGSSLWTSCRIPQQSQGEVCRSFDFQGPVPSTETRGSWKLMVKF